MQLSQCAGFQACFLVCLGFDRLVELKEGKKREALCPWDNPFCEMSGKLHVSELLGVAIRSETGRMARLGGLVAYSTSGS